MKKINKGFYILAAVLVMALVFPTVVSAAPLENGKTVFGESYSLESGEILDGNLNVIGGVVDIQNGAVVSGDMFSLGAVVTIDGTIEGDFTIIGGVVTLQENAVIEGNLISPASNINRDEGAVVEGEQVGIWNIPWTDLPLNYQPGVVKTPNVRILPVLNSLARKIAETFVIVALGALMLLIMPKSTEVMTEALIAKPWHMLGYGALTALVMLVGGVILTITICLIPVVILVGLAFGFAILAGWLALGYELGKRISSSIFKTTWHPVLAAVIGNLVLYLLAIGLDLIPCFGGFLVFITALFGLGMAVVTLFGTNRYPREETINGDQQEVLFGEEGAGETDVLLNQKETNEPKEEPEK